MNTREEIDKDLRDALAPLALDVIDESHLHAGHAGHRPDGETHFRIRIVTALFSNVSRLSRHRRVNAVLARHLSPGGVHALAIEARAPGEG